MHKSSNKSSNDSPIKQVFLSSSAATRNAKKNNGFVVFSMGGDEGIKIW